MPAAAARRCLLRKSPANPILGPEPRHAWEAALRTNPGAWYDAQQKKVYLLYRAAGLDKEHRIYFGLATSSDGEHFTPVSDEPVFAPSIDGYDSGCVEDPRIIKVGEWFYVTYACKPYPPGEYWLGLKHPDRWWPAPRPDDFPWIYRSNQTTTGLAMTRDFKTWHRAGRLTLPTLDDRDVVIFPEKIGNQYVMIHRPMQWHGERYGTPEPAVWMMRSDDILSWDYANSKLLFKAQYEWERKVGGNGPPLRTDAGWLFFYHGVGPDKYYRLGAVLLDLDDPSKVTHRTPMPILEPEYEHETKGYYGGGGVVFPCGNVIIDGKLFLYYGGADKYCCVATIEMRELLDYLLANPV